jgi:hypothetical protein
VLLRCAGILCHEPLSIVGLAGTESARRRELPGWWWGVPRARGADGAVLIGAID